MAVGSCTELAQKLLPCAPGQASCAQMHTNYLGLLTLIELLSLKMGCNAGQRAVQFAPALSGAAGASCDEVAQLLLPCATGLASCAQLRRDAQRCVQTVSDYLNCLRHFTDLWILYRPGIVVYI